MRRFFALMSQLPLATLAGAALGVFTALLAVLLSLGPLEGSSYPLAPFALAPLPAVLGAWLDWARLWRPSRRTRFWSAAALALSGLACLDAYASQVAGGSAIGLLVAPAVPLSFALVVVLGARAALGLTRSGRTTLGVALVDGVVRRDEIDRVVVDTRTTTVEIDRRHPELGSQRSVDLSIGAPLTLLARLRDTVGDGDPFRSERRSEATLVLGVASSPEALRAVWQTRARAWTAYLVGLAIAAAALTAAASYSPSRADDSIRRGLERSTVAAR